jgi:hypothetical protein
MIETANNIETMRVMEQMLLLTEEIVDLIKIKYQSK